MPRADAIFVFGEPNFYPASKAAELFEDGYAKNVFSIARKGTFSNKEWRFHDSTMYKHYWKICGYGNRFYTSPIAANTLEEAQKAISFMKEHDIVPKKVVLVASPVHQLRAYLTFKKHNPNIEIINVMSDEGFSFGLIARFFQEMYRIIKYRIKGDL